MKYIVAILMIAVIIMVALPIAQKNSHETFFQEEIEDIPSENISKDNYDDKIKSEKINYKPYFFENTKIHGITMKDTVVYSSTQKETITAKIKKGEFLSILSMHDNLYEVEYKNQNGYVESTDVSYYKFHNENRYTLASDVSQFNYGTDFKNSGDFAFYLLNNDFNYVIMRIGGRGYGKPGKMYYDKKTDFFASVCEYLGIPYGYYFLDEALTEEEVKEEVKFVTDYIKLHPGKFQVLPISIDMEYQHGSGRADLAWEDRVALVNILIEELKKEKIDCMLYANGARIETYLKKVNCPYWTAMYPVDNKIPTKFYDEYIREQEQINIEHPENIENSILNTEVNRGGTDTLNYSEEYFKKVVGWQFTENAASLDGIVGMLDLSLMDNDYFEAYYLKAFE